LIERNNPFVFGALYWKMEKPEIQSAARQMIWLHGPRAQVKAGEQADNMFSLGDIAGFHKWNKVTDAIKDLERKTQAPEAPEWGCGAPCDAIPSVGTDPPKPTRSGR
jgi:hypothetical protein